MTTTVLPPEDPHGDRAWQEEQRKKRLAKGRSAILGAEDYGDWTPPESDPEGDDGDEDEDARGEGDPPPKKVHRGLRYQRLTEGGEIVWTTLGPIQPDDKCPVTPLGRDGKIFFFLTKKGQLVSYEDGKIGQAHLEALFADELWWLMRYYPQFNQGGTLTGFKANYARMALFTSCAQRDVFDVREKVRGLGCWRGENGELIQHLGNEVLIDGEKHAPGFIGDHVYPGRPAVPPPMEGDNKAALTIFEDLMTWNWGRGELDVRLALGWIGSAILGAALDWRPMVFFTGDAGSGKSTVQERLKKLLPGRLASTVDATPAALRQMIGQDAIAVSFDEIEADVNNDQGTNVMKLARVAASGGTTYRGGKDHSASEFTLRGCFAFSAIVPPSMRVQDLQRITFLRLQPLKKGGRPKKFTDAELKRLGQQLAGRMAKGWARWDDTLAAYEAGLERLGHNQRGARQFGTMLAACDLMLYDEVPVADVVDGWVKGLEREALYEFETADPMWLKAFRHIVAAQPEVWRTSGSPSVAEKVRAYINALGDDDRRAEQRRLNRAGLAVVQDRATGQFWLAIPREHQQISAIFKDSDLRASGGEGAWSQALRGATRWHVEENPDGIYRVENVPQLGRIKCTLIRLSATHDVAGEKVPIFDFEPDESNKAV